MKPTDHEPRTTNHERINWVDRVITYAFYTLFIVTPLLFNPSRSLPSFELFEWNKMMFVYLLTMIITAGWAIRMILAKKIIFTRTPFDIPLWLFLGTQILSTLFSIDRHVSIFGYYSRFHGGLLSTISYVVLFHAFVANRSLFRISQLISLSLLSTTLVATYGLLEKIGIDEHMWVQDVKARVFSTLGQPNWLAALLAINLPISFGFLLVQKRSANVIARSEERTTKQSQTESPRSLLTRDIIFKFILSKQLSFLIIVVLLYLCLLFTKSRSGFLGFWFANTFFWLSIFFFSFKKRLQVTTYHLLPIFLILNASFLLLNFFIKTPLPLYNRFASIEMAQSEPSAPPPPPAGSSIIDVGITDSGVIRKIVWEGAIRIIKDFPLFGTGPETFAYSYYKYRPQAHNLTSEWDFLYNKAHNEFLNIAATSGLFGLGAYLILILSVYIFAFKNNALKQPFHPKTLLGIALIAGYTSIHITNFFGFSVVVIGLYFFLIPAILFSLRSSENVSPAEEKMKPFQILLGSFIMVFLVIGLYTLAKYWIADSFYAKALSLKRQEEYAESYRTIHAAVGLRASEPVYQDELANITSALSSLAAIQNEATVAAQLAKEAIDASSLALVTSPQNVTFWKTRTRVLYQLATINPEFLSSALDTIRVAEELAPTDAKIAYNVGVLLEEAGKTAEAIAQLQKTIELKADYRDAYIALAIIYEKHQDKSKAQAVLKLVLERINPDDQEVKQRLEQLK